MYDSNIILSPHTHTFPLLTKRFDLLLIGALLCAPAYAERTVSYERANQNVTLNLDGQAGNYGDITWQYSDDGGSSRMDCGLFVADAFS